jgi:hypothetical protein
MRIAQIPGFQILLCFLLRFTGWVPIPVRETFTEISGTAEAGLKRYFCHCTALLL